MNTKEKIDLIKQHLPQFSSSHFQIENMGWANQVICVDNQFIFRFPRNAMSLLELEVEKLILPQVYDDLSQIIDIPCFQYHSQTGDPHEFVGYKMIPGQPMTPNFTQNMSQPVLTENKKRLGHFLSHLHNHPTLNDLSILNKKPSQGERWQRLRLSVIERGSHLLSEKEIEWVNKLLEALITVSSHFSKKALLLHADFSSDHILIDPISHKITGIIDFGDLEIGDPALDFTGLYLSYGKAFTQDVIDHYNACNRQEGYSQEESILDRVIQLYVKQVPLHLLVHGLEKKSDKIINEAKLKIHKLMEGELHDFYCPQ